MVFAGAGFFSSRFVSFDAASPQLQPRQSAAGVFLLTDQVAEMQKSKLFAQS
jgi:hypothetical protein